MNDEAAVRLAALHAARVLSRRALRTVIRIFAVVFAGTFVVGLLALWWAGFLDRADVSEQTLDPSNYLYKEQRGSYERIRFAIRDVSLYARQRTNAQPQRGFSVYFDDPRDTPTEALRSIVGCLTDTLLSAEPPYLSRRSKSMEAVVAAFPLRSPFSYMTGVLKAYPDLHEYVEEHGIEIVGPVLEVYDLGARTIFYIAPMTNPPFMPDSIPGADPFAQGTPVADRSVDSSGDRAPAAR